MRLAAVSSPPNMGASHTLPGEDSGHDRQLVAAAARIVAEAAQDGGSLSQAALARKLRTQGYSIPNDRLRWLSSACGLGTRHE